MFYIYIIKSEKDGKYYVGYSKDPTSRLLQHNETSFDSFTVKYRPWKLVAILLVGPTEKMAVRIEGYIKKQKQRRFLELVIEKQSDTNFIEWLKNKCSAG